MIDRVIRLECDSSVNEIMIKCPAFIRSHLLPAGSTTDVAGLGILGANWSVSQATGNASALVPELTTLSLLAMSVLAVGHRRH